MSNLGLFIMGAFVTLLVTASMTLLIWAAILDGRDEHDRLEAEAEAEGARPDRRLTSVTAA